MNIRPLLNYFIPRSLHFGEIMKAACSLAPGEYYTCISKREFIRFCKTVDKVRNTKTPLEVVGGITMSARNGLLHIIPDDLRWNGEYIFVRRTDEM